MSLTSIRFCPTLLLLYSQCLDIYSRCLLRWHFMPSGPRLRMLGYLAGTRADGDIGGAA